MPTALPSNVLTLHAISNGALTSPTLPARLKLLNWGRNETSQGAVVVGDKTLATLPGNNRARGYAEVAIDFEHNTVAGSAEYQRTKEPRSVAGYGKPEVLRGEGLFLTAIRWTPEGEASARNYMDLSPTPELDEQRNVTFLHSLALVRNGAVHDLSFFSAAKAAQNQKPFRLYAEMNVAPDYKALGWFDQLTWRDLAGPLGLSATASRQEIAVALKAVLERASLPLSADSLGARVLLKGAMLMIEAGQPSGLARSVRAARREAHPHLRLLSAAGMDTGVPITAYDFLTALGVDIPPGTEGTGLWSMMGALLNQNGNPIGVNDLAGMLHHEGEPSRDSVLKRIEEIASQAKMSVATFSATTGAVAGAHLTSRIVTLGVTALCGGRETGLDRAISAHRRETGR